MIAEVFSIANIRSSIQLVKVNFQSIIIFFHKIFRVKLSQGIDDSQWYAIKIMKDDSINTHEKLEKLMNEVRLLSQCSHPNVVELLSISVTGTLVKASGYKKHVIYYVMPYMVFGELCKIMYETGRFQEVLARTFFTHVISGILYLNI